MIKEEEVEELVKKSQQLETELDWTNERLRFVTLQLEEKEKALLAAEAEVNALKEERLLLANQKLDKAASAADGNVLENNESSSSTSLRDFCMGIDPFTIPSPKKRRKYTKQQKLHYLSLLYGDVGLTAKENHK